MEQHHKWIVYGSDGLLVGGKGCFFSESSFNDGTTQGKGCTRMRPEVAPARSGSWARFSNHWFHGILPSRTLEGCEHCATPIYSSVLVVRFKSVDTSEVLVAHWQAAGLVTRRVSHFGHVVTT